MATVVVGECVPCCSDGSPCVDECGGCFIVPINVPQQVTVTISGLIAGPVWCPDCPDLNGPYLLDRQGGDGSPCFLQWFAQTNEICEEFGGALRTSLLIRADILFFNNAEGQCQARLGITVESAAFGRSLTQHSGETIDIPTFPPACVPETRVDVTSVFNQSAASFTISGPTFGFSGECGNRWDFGNGEIRITAAA